MSERLGAVAVRAERRLRTPAQFAAVAAARGARALRGARRWLAVNCWVADAGTVPNAAPARLGLVMPKRHARRAIDRNLIKRVVREAMRAAVPVLDAAAAAVRLDGGQDAGSVAGARLDIVVRLKAPLPPVADLPRAQLKSALRVEADTLLAGLVRDLRPAAEGRRP